MRFCLVPRCSHPPHWHHHQRHLADDWMPASYTNGPSSYLRRPAEHRLKGATLSPACRAMEHGHLLHSALTCPVSGYARHLKSRHPFVPAAQQLISSSDDNNRRAALWADHRWNAEWLENTTKLRTFIPDIDTHPPGMALPWTAWILHSQMGYGSFCGLWVWHRRTDHWPYCPPMSNPSNSWWTGWPDGSGWWDNRMAAQHLPRDLVRPSSGLKELVHTMKKFDDWLWQLRSKNDDGKYHCKPGRQWWIYKC